MQANPPGPPSVEVVHSTKDKVSTAQALQSIPGVEVVGEHTEGEQKGPKDLETVLAELKATRNGLSSGEAQVRSNSLQMLTFYRVVLLSLAQMPFQRRKLTRT